MIIIIIIIILKTLLVMFAFLIMPKYSMTCEIVKKKVKKKRPLPNFNDKRKGTVGVTYPNVKYASAIHIPICC